MHAWCFPTTKVYGAFRQWYSMCECSISSERSLSCTFIHMIKKNLFFNESICVFGVGVRAEKRRPRVCRRNVMLTDVWHDIQWEISISILTYTYNEVVASRVQILSESFFNLHFNCNVENSKTQIKHNNQTTNLEKGKPDRLSLIYLLIFLQI